MTYLRLNDDTWLNMDRIASVRFELEGKRETARLWAEGQSFTYYDENDRTAILDWLCENDYDGRPEKIE